MDLKFTPRTVKEIEDRAKLPITSLIGVFSAGNVALLVEAGLKHIGPGVNQDIALDKLEAYLNEGHDMFEVYMLILEKLQAGGFLPRTLNLQTLREQLNDPELLTKEIQNNLPASATLG